MLFKYFLISFLGASLSNCNAVTGQALPNRPIVLGPLVGLILGDVVQGTIIGATLELAYIGAIVIGISTSINMTVAGLLGTTYAMVSGSGPEVAVTLALPCSLLVTLVNNFYAVFRVWMTRKTDAAVQTGDIHKFELWHWIMFFARWLSTFPVYFIALWLGGPMITTIVEAVPPVIMQGLQASTKLMPGLGFAMLLNMCWSKEVGAFFFIGFVFSVYLGLDNIAVGILGACFAVIAFFFTKSDDAAEEELEAEIEEPVKREKLLDRATLRKICLRSYCLEAAFNMEKFQGFGYAYMMVPAIKKLYNDPQDQKDALIRHTEFFNTTPTIVTFITGISCAMEEERSQGGAMTDAAISGVKVALMGPSAGIGDAIFWGSWRIIATSIACQMGLAGNVLAPFVFLFIFNVPNVLLHWYGLIWTYDLGNSFIQKLYQSNLMDKITLCCSIMGMTMIGAMTASMVSVSTALQIDLGTSVFVLQDLLDSILPGALSLITVFAISKVLKKQVSVLTIMFALMGIGILGKFIGFF